MKFIVWFVFFWLFLIKLFGQKVIVITAVEYMDLIDGGASALHVTGSDGKEEHQPLKGLYSFGGYISEKKVRDNDEKIATKLEDYFREGWELLHVTTAVQPKTDTGKPPCIITRYYLVNKNLKP